MAIDLSGGGPIEAPRLAGDLRWIRDAQPILEVFATSEDAMRAVTLEGVVLGGQPGRRTWRADVIPHETRGWAEVSLADGHASIDLPDPYGAGEQFGSIHAALFPDEPTPSWVAPL